ncbi:Ig-like domain-containing protein [Reinekea blandensis]|nr:Ig-like domain-containing protein [Reinekea blandensis]
MKPAGFAALTLAAIAVGCGPTDDKDNTTDLTIQSISPAQDSTDVDVRAELSVQFSQDIDTDTLLDDHIQLLSSVTGKEIPGLLTYDADSRTLTFTPDFILASDTEYQVQFAAGLTDEQKSLLPAQDWTFTTNHDYQTVFRSTTEQCVEADCDTELWAWGEDGKAFQVADIHPTDSSDPSVPTVRYKDLYYFSAETDAEGREVWVTDGTPSYTKLFADIVEGPISSKPENFTVHDDLLFFTTQSEGINTLWKTNGSADNLEAVVEYSELRNLNVVNGHLVFSAYEEATGVELYVLTDEGATMLDDLNEGAEGSAPGPFQLVGDQLFFQATDDENGDALFKTDGETITLVSDVDNAAKGRHDLNVDDMLAFNGRLFFTADDGEHGTQPWISDGTAEGTVMITELNEGNGYGLDSVVEWQGEIYFAEKANDILWKTDGTSEGTIEIADYLSWGGMMSTDNGLVISAITNGEKGLWLSQGEPNDLELFYTQKEVTDLSSGPNRTGIFVNDPLLANTHSFHLTDGTFEGTVEIQTEQGLYFPVPR